MSVRLLGTYVPGNNPFYHDIIKVVVTRVGKEYREAWHYANGEVSEGTCFVNVIKDDVARGYLLRVEKHMVLPEGL